MNFKTQISAIKSYLKTTNVVKINEVFCGSFLGVKNSVVTVNVRHKSGAVSQLAFLVETTPEGNNHVIMEVDN